MKKGISIFSNFKKKLYVIILLLSCCSFLTACENNENTTAIVGYVDVSDLGRGDIYACSINDKDKVMLDYYEVVFYKTGEDAIYHHDQYEGVNISGYKYSEDKKTITTYSMENKEKIKKDKPSYTYTLIETNSRDRYNHTKKDVIKVTEDYIKSTVSSMSDITFEKDKYTVYAFDNTWLVIGVYNAMPNAGELNKYWYYLTVNYSNDSNYKVDMEFWGELST